MRRVMILGPPGSGKSTLARRLGSLRGLPVFHLDRAWWRPGWIQAPMDEFSAEVSRIAALPTWVIDGNYTFEIGPRLQAADTMIYLDVPSWLCLARIVRRILTSRGTVRPDASPGCPERWDLAFLRFAWNWNRLRRPGHLAMIASFDGRGIVLRGGGAVRKFLKQ